MLFDAGYLARIEIPPQEIDGGRVRLQVIEARITSVEVTGNAPAAVSKVRDYLSRLDGLAPFDLDAVQRAILLASDIPGVTISTNVRPAAGEAGAVKIVVNADRQPVNLVAAAQNYGSSAIGPWTVLGRVDLNSLTPLGERTSLVVSATPDLDEQRVVQLLEEVRIGGSGLLARGSVSFGESNPGAELAPLDIESDSFVGELGLAYPVIRSRRLNLWFSGGVEFVNQATDLFDNQSRLVDDKLRVATARVDLDRRFTLFNLPVISSGGIEVRKGLNAFGASDKGEVTLSRAAANPQAWSVRLNSRSEVLIAPRFSLASASLIQWANDPLLAYEELSIGNFTIGRGYDPGSVSGDRGWASSLELRYGPVRLGKATAQAFAFYDTAWVKNLDPGPGSGKYDVKSVGGGVRLGLGRRFALDLAYARPLDPAIPGGSKPGDRLLINFTSFIR